MSERSFTVSQVAKLAHVTVRALHHYDEIGLLCPSDRSRAGYRLYAEEDLARLQQILLFRELGFTLEAIKELVDEPVIDRRGALRAQRQLLVERRQRTEAVIAAVDRALAALEEGTTMAPEKMFEGFEGLDPYAEEAKERWGETDSYKESMRRTRRYSKEDWARLGAEGEAIEAALAARLAEGHRPDDPEVTDLAERHRLHIDRWFYPCSREHHVALGEMYVADPRFAAHYDQRRQGLAAFVSAAIRANAAREDR